MPDSTHSRDYIGYRVAAWRELAGLSQQQLAERIGGYDRSYIAKIESGARPVLRRPLQVALANALGVNVWDLTAEPTPPRTAEELVFYSLAPQIRRALDGEDEPIGPPRNLSQLTDAVRTVEYAQMAADWDTLAALLPELLAELALGDGDTQRLLYVRALIRATLSCHLAGYADLARLCAERSVSVAEAVGDAVHNAGAAFALGQAALAGGSSHRSLTVVEAGAERLQLQSGPTDTLAAGLAGMLHLHSAISAAALGEAGLAGDHLAEADELAAYPTDSWGLEFGPANVSVWRVSVADEMGDWGRAPELAAKVDRSALRTADRMARLDVDAARGWYEVGKRDRATVALLEAMHTSARATRVLPCVREITAQLARDAGPRGGSEQLRKLVTWVGVDPLTT